MKYLLKYVEKLALVFWLGEMLFFIVAIAPKVFKILPRDLAAKFQQELFVTYFNIGISCGFILLLIHLFKRNQLKTWKFSLMISMIFVGLLSFLYCRYSISPELTSLQSEVAKLPMGSVDSPEGARFQFLHQLSVQLNAATLIALLILLAFI